MLGEANAKNDPTFPTLPAALFHVLAFGVNELLDQLFRTHVHPECTMQLGKMWPS